MRSVNGRLIVEQPVASSAAAAVSLAARLRRQRDVVAAEVDTKVSIAADPWELGQYALTDLSAREVWGGRGRERAGRGGHRHEAAVVGDSAGPGNRLSLQRRSGTPGSM